MPDSEQAWKNTIDKYNRYIDSVSKYFTSSINELVFDLNFHDAKIKSLIKNQDNVILSLMIGGRQIKYSRVLIRYSNSNARIIEAEYVDFTRDDCEVVFDELFRHETGSWEHNLLLWPYGEIHIEFGDLSIEVFEALESERLSTENLRIEI